MSGPRVGAHEVELKTPRAVDQTGEALRTMDTKTMDEKHDTTATPWLTIEQAATIAQCGNRLLYREIQAGRLRAARIGGRRDLRIHREWIDAWLIASAEPVEVRR